MHIRTVREFIQSLRDGSHTSLGSYPKYWLAADGGELSYDACMANCGRIARAIRGDAKRADVDPARFYSWDDTQWRVIGCDVNWEDRSMFCADTGERIESAYAEDAVRPIPSGTTVKVKAHHSEQGKGLRYSDMTAELIDACETDGWDVIDVRMPDGTETSVYSFSVERA